MEKYCFNCHRHGRADCPSIAGDAACYTFEMQPAVKNCHRWIKEGSAAEERGTIDKQPTNSTKPAISPCGRAANCPWMSFKECDLELCDEYLPA